MELGRCRCVVLIFLPLSLSFLSRAHVPLFSPVGTWTHSAINPDIIKSRCCFLVYETEVERKKSPVMYFGVVFVGAVLKSSDGQIKLVLKKCLLPSFSTQCSLAASGGQECEEQLESIRKNELLMMLTLEPSWQLGQSDYCCGPLNMSLGVFSLSFFCACIFLMYVFGLAFDLR